MLSIVGSVTMNLIRSAIKATAIAAVVGFSGIAPSKAAVMVGQCVEFAACYSSTVNWSHNLTLAELVSLGLGTNEPFIAKQTSQFVIRLGTTTVTFNTSGGPVTESLGEFNGLASHNDPGPYETDTVGMFFIPLTA